MSAPFRDSISERVLDGAAEYRLKIEQLDGDGILKNHSRAEFIRLLHKANAAELHVPIRFVLDSNDWSAPERRKLCSLQDNDGEQIVHFLKRMEIENYLLHADAVLFALKNTLAIRQMSDVKPSTAEVRKIIDAHSGEKGSEILNAVFAKWGCDYSKNRDAQFLLEYLIEKAPEWFQELIEELTPVLTGKATEQQHR